MTRSFTSAILFLFFCLSTFGIKASHVVGGNISYTYLGNDVYGVQLRLYRDSVNGLADFPDTAIIRVYEGNAFYKKVYFVHGAVSVLPPEISGTPCYSAPPLYVVEYSDYIGTLYLPSSDSVYTLNYEICCRNFIINNIYNPGQISSVISASIPAKDSLGNNSPHLIDNPPPVLCLNTPIKFTLRLSEADGDSLVYSLCNARQTSSIFPYYQSVVYRPPQSGRNPLPANPDLSIDRFTGEVRGKPTLEGVFVASFCVSEFDSTGQLKEIWHLDYQFSVVKCKHVSRSDMVSPDEDPSINCDGLSVQFQSETSKDVELFWDFGVTGSVTDTSTAKHPVYTFPQTGIYPVMLVAGPGTDCADTMIVNFPVYENFNISFEHDGYYCFSRNLLNFKVTNNTPAFPEFEWDFGPDANYPYYKGKSPPGIKWSAPGQHPVTLTARYANCSQSITKNIRIIDDYGGIDAGPDQKVFVGDEVQLQASIGTDYYWWSRETPLKLSSRSTRQTTVSFIKPDTVTIYLRMVNNQGCEGTDSLKIYVLERFTENSLVNLISPNGDGRNEVLDLSEVNNGSCSIRIINRWGNEVWRDEVYKNDWSGTDEGGNSLPDGTYYYLLDCGLGTPLRGPVTLIRNPF